MSFLFYWHLEGKKEILSCNKLSIVHEYKVFLPTKQRLQFMQCKRKIVTKCYCSWIWKALAYLWGLSKSMLGLHGLSFSSNHFFFSEICKSEIYLVQNLGENRSTQTFAENHKLKPWIMTGQTKKQVNKKDTIWTSFEFQMLHCPGLMDHSLNLILFLLKLSSIFNILWSNLSTEDNLNKLV